MGTATIISMVISAALGICGIISLIIAVLNYNRNNKLSTQQTTAADTSMKNDIDYVRRRVDDILLEQKDTSKSMAELTQRVTRNEESAKQAHKRIDELNERICKYESVN